MMPFSDRLSLKRSMELKDIILEELRKQGCRITEQRKLIIDIILQNDCACCKEIYAKAVKKDPSIGIATIYRMINALEDIGVLDPRNLYKVSCSDISLSQGECVAILRNQEKVLLSMEQFSQVIKLGLSMLDEFKDKEIASVMMNFSPHCIKVNQTVQRKEKL